MKKILLILILFLFSMDYVYAKTYSDKFYSGELISNMYVKKIKNGETKSKQARFMRRESDGGVGYCIEPFELLNEDIKYTGYDEEAYKKLGISEAKWNKISLIAYYGYGYSNHTSDKWYYITQVMIWRVVDEGASFYFTDSLGGEKINDYDDEINEINNLIESHNVLPSFANKTYTYSIEENVILIDTNNVLENYKMEEFGDLSIKQNGNSLSFSSDDALGLNLNFSKKFEKYERPAVAFIDSRGQNVITAGNPETINFNLSIQIASGKIKINKFDYDTQKKEPLGSGILIGSEFTIYDSDDKIVEVLTINEEYEAYSKELPSGKYTIKETKSMSGYLLNNQEYSIELNGLNDYIELDIKNEIIKSKIELYKYYDYKLEPGISFEIYDKDNNLIDTLTTDEEGKIEKELYYGKYVFHQVNTTQNYLKVDDFEVIIDEVSPKVITFNLNDERFSSKLIILKRDSKTNKVIEDEVIYNIYDLTNKKYIEIEDSMDLRAEKGILVIEKLEAGKYIIEEEKAPKGYKKTDKKVEVIIDEDNDFKYDENNYPIYEVSIENDREIIKIDVPNTDKSYELNVELFYDDKKRDLKLLLTR